LKTPDKQKEHFSEKRCCMEIISLINCWLSVIYL